MSVSADNLSYVETSDGTWHAIGDLTLPDGTTAHMDQQLTPAEHAYFKGVLAKVYPSNYIAGYGGLTPQALVAWITAQASYTASPPTMTMADVEAYIQSQTVPGIQDDDVPRLVALMDIGPDIAAEVQAPTPTTTFTPPPITA